MASASHLPVGAMSRLAWRNLWRNQRRTIIMLLAIAVGVWAMIFMTALMRGMVDQMIEDGIVSLPGLVQVHDPAFRDDPSIEHTIAQPGTAQIKALNHPEVTGWTTRLRVPAMISSERDSRGVTLLGVDPKGEIALGFDPGSIIEGRFLDSAEDNGLVIGRKLLERLETGVGKRVVLMSQDPENNVADRGFRIVGVYKAKLSSLEETYIYGGLSTIQNLLDVKGEVSEIAVNGKDYREVGPLLDLVSGIYGETSEVLAWTELDTYLGIMLKMMDGFVLVWIVVIFLALSFGLVNTLMMAVLNASGR
jgi:ABC-type lipoprotein release transport system permease subunit